MSKIWGLGCAVLLLGLSSAHAQQAATAEEIKALVTGKSMTIGNGVATYKADGAYEYFSQDNAQTSRGKYSIQGNRLCVDFANNSSRCDQITKEGGKFYLTNSRGTKYEMKAK